MEKIRKPQRLPDYDYSTSGAYFVTICTKEREQVLAAIANEEVQLKRAERIVERVWRELPKHYTNIELDEFVIMPNHIHGIVWIKAQESVGEGLKPSRTRHGLTEIIRGLKTFSARRVNELRGTPGQPFWQRSFYDHAIEDEANLHQHRAYILNNPLKWSLDRYHQ